MKPILLRFSDGSQMYSAPFFLFLGGLAAIVLIAMEMRRTRERPEEIYGLLFFLFVSALLGARLLYTTDFYEKYHYSLLDVLRFWKGGLALHGGAIFAFATYVLYIGWRRLDFWGTADLLTPAATLFVFFARIGCIFTGCCYGKESDPSFPMAMTFTEPATFAPKNVPLYPTQVQFAVAALLVFVILWVRRKTKRFDGETALMGLSIYSLSAFGIEFLRGDLRILYEIAGFSFTQNQVILAVAFLSAIGIYFFKRYCRALLSKNGFHEG